MDEFGVASTGESFSVMRLANEKLFSIGDSRQMGTLPLDNKLKSAMKLHFGVSEKQIKSVESSFYKFIVKQNIFEHVSLKKVYRLTPRLVELVDVHYQTVSNAPFLIPANKESTPDDLDSHSFLLLDSSHICNEQIINISEYEKDDKLWESNLPHAELGTLLISSILKNNTFNYQDIGLITPYNRQIDIYKKLLKEEGVEHPKIAEFNDQSNLTIGTVYPFQGDERPITIVDLVRHDSIMPDFTGGTGFIDKEMLLVMMSRSRKGPLIVIANMETFRRSRKQSVNKIMSHVDIMAKRDSLSFIDVKSLQDVDISKHISIWEKTMEQVRGS